MQSSYFVDVNLYSWGNSSYGQTGTGKRVLPVELREPADVLFSPQAVSCGFEHTAAIGETGSVYTWGSNEFGQLGDGTEEDRHKPQLVKTLANRSVLQVACGAHSTAVVLSSGEVFQWGRYTFSNWPHCVSLPAQASSVACGFSHMAAVVSGGLLFTWGYNEHGELGHGDTFEGLRRPRQVKYFSHLRDIQDDDISSSNSSGDEEEEADGVLKVVSVACGAHHTVAITQDKEVYSWGDGSCGQLGHLTGTRMLFPRHIAALENLKIKQVSCGEKHSAFVTEEGELLVCGHHAYGVLGLGKPAPSLDRLISQSDRQLYMGTGSSQGQPVQRVPTTLIPFGVLQVACGAAHTLITTVSGQVWACGYDFYGQTSGCPGRMNEIWDPVLLTPLEGADVLSSAAGAGHSIVLSRPQTLSRMCQRALLGKLNVDTAPALWETAHHLNADGLATMTLSYMKHHANAITDSDSMQCLSSHYREKLVHELSK